MNEERREAIRKGVIRRRIAEGTYSGQFVRTTKVCEKCGKDFKPHRSSQRLCSSECRNKYQTKEQRNSAAKDAVVRRRKKLKALAVEFKGGRCEICGYSKCIEALEFHHIDPSEKDFSISGKSFSWKRVKEEVSKCVLLCANCHREEHAKNGWFDE